MSENTIAVSESHLNNIDYNGDVDTYDIWLVAGQSYDFDVYGWANGDSNVTSPGMFDPTLTVTGHGQSVFDDDGGLLDRDAHIDFTAGTTGWYTLSVAGWNGETGPYTLFTGYDDGAIAV